jgi:hypothetical protein
MERQAIGFVANWIINPPSPQIQQNTPAQPRPRR